MRLLFVILAFAACSSPTPQFAQQTIPEAEEPTRVPYALTKVVDDVEIPWGLSFLPDGSILYTEKELKQLVRVRDGRKTLIGGLPNDILVKGQGGLLDVLYHDGWVYLSYASSAGAGKGGHTKIIRGQIEGDRLVAQRVLYKGTPNTNRGHHWGSRLAIGADGLLYFTIGDRGNRDENPQDLTRDGGKVYRLHPNGDVPTDNPYHGVAGNLPQIYSYGHRNPQGMDVHPVTGEVWTHEHGPRGGDELNRIQPGTNYGWPVITYGRNYTGTKITDETARPGMEQPVYYWLPSIAPSGMAWVTDRYPAWAGDVLVGSLKFLYLERLDFEDGRVVGREKLFPNRGRVRSVERAVDGTIYVGIEYEGIFRID